MQDVWHNIGTAIGFILWPMLIVIFGFYCLKVIVWIGGSSADSIDKDKTIKGIN